MDSSSFAMILQTTYEKHLFSGVLGAGRDGGVGSSIVEAGLGERLLLRARDFDFTAAKGALFPNLHSVSITHRGDHPQCTRRWARHAVAH